MTTERSIDFEISRNKYGEILIETKSKYVDAEDRRIEACSYNMYDKMEGLACKYNNHPDGCIAVIFTMT